jgi:uncharacterized membrane protein
MMFVGLSVLAIVGAVVLVRLTWRMCRKSWQRIQGGFRG